jgi:hypothetical protein
VSSASGSEKSARKGGFAVAGCLGVSEAPEEQGEIHLVVRQRLQHCAGELDVAS